MRNEDIVQAYSEITEYYNKFLKKHGVKMPALRNSQGRFLKDTLVLIKLFQGYPATNEVTKDELTSFIKKFYPEINDVQQARHLAMQKGWYIASGTRGDLGVNYGAYKLVTLELPYPAYCNNRREGFKGDFDKIKQEYGYRCATCGSKEGEEHYFRKGVKVQLQEGHMNPSKPLVAGNIIPQCQICNRPDRNKWIFDKTGRVIAIAASSDGTRIVKKFLSSISFEAQTEIYTFLKNLLNKD